MAFRLGGGDRSIINPILEVSMTNHPGHLSTTGRMNIAVGILVDRDPDRLAATISNAKVLTDRIFLLEMEPSEPLHAVLDAFELEGDRLCTAREPGDRAAARNDLIEQIEKESDADWVLWMEEGERFDESTLRSFQEFLTEEADRHSIYFMVLRRLVRADEIRHDLDEETIDPRLMPLRKGLRFHGRVRESLLQSAQCLMIQLNAAPGRILCPSRFADMTAQKHLGERKLRLLESIRDQGESIVEEYLAFQAEARSDAGDHVGARNDYLELIKTTRKANLRLEACYGLWETLMFSPVSADETTRILLSALDHFPVDMQLLTFMGSHLQRQGQIDLAVRTYETAVRHGQVSLDVWHRLHIREIAVVSLALSLRIKGNPREAIQVLEANLEQIGDRSEYARHLLDLYIAEFQESRARDFAAAIWGDEELDRIRDVLTGACRASAGAWEAAALSLESAYIGGCRDLLCLRWYSMTLLSLARYREAIPVLEEWMSADPESLEARAFFQAANQPEHFNEIVARMQAEQRRILGWSGPEPSSIDVAVREMVDSSATRFESSSELRSPLEGDGPSSPIDGIEIEPDEDDTSKLLFRPGR